MGFGTAEIMRSRSGAEILISPETA